MHKLADKDRHKDSSIIPTEFIFSFNNLLKYKNNFFWQVVTTDIVIIVMAYLLRSLMNFNLQGNYET